MMKTLAHTKRFPNIGLIKQSNTDNKTNSGFVDSSEGIGRKGHQKNTLAIQ